MKNTLFDSLFPKNTPVFFDGGTGSLLVARGLTAGEKPEYWNLTHPEVIEELHRAYIGAGADIIKTNTFGAYRHKLGDKTEACVRAALENARKAVEKAGKGTKIALDLGPTGKLLAPLGDLPFEEAVSVFSETVKLGKDSADLVLIETMSDLYELKAAVLAAKESCALPILVTVALDERGKLLTGADVKTVAALLEGLGVAAFGVNCGFGPSVLLPFVKEMAAVSSLPLIVNPNAGLPRVEGGKTVYDLTPEGFAAEMKELFPYATLMGGCCGTTPDHIAALKKAAEGITAPTLTEKNLTVVSSATHTVTFGKEPVLIGERLNPTGKPKLKAALREENYGYLAAEGIAQVEKGAMILDVNVGLPELDEPGVLCRAITTLQEITDIPLQIDTSDPVAMEKACRIYNGKPLLNSVSGKRESMEAVFPIAKKYGGVVIALTLDENGIPDRVEGRVAIAERILSVAVTYGLSAKDLIFDPLALTVSSDPFAALTTVNTVKALTELGYKTSLGVSNVSFGLPERDRINSAFFTVNLSAGLSAAIMNPFSEGMMNAYRTFRLLTALDPSGVDYIASFGEKETLSSDTLQGAIVKGLAEKTAALTEAALRETAPLTLINKEIVPALDLVGEGFEKGKLFLPQLLASAEAAKAAFEVVKAKMPKGNAVGNEKKIVLATVKGDIHDIGKNIVKVMLENYGYTVIDLGRDVPPEAVVEAVRREGARLVSLSALMTTTVPSMEATVKALRSAGLDCKVMVGGAVLTEEYAEMIGADRYAKDAAEAVRYAEAILGRA